MNFRFAVGDEVILSRTCGRGPKDTVLVLVREYVAGVFHAELPDGSVLRVRSSELVRVRRPSDDAARAQVAERRAQREIERAAKLDRVRRNREEFEHMEQYRVRLTADGLPDKRCKPKFSAKNAPQSIRSRGRSNLL